MSIYSEALNRLNSISEEVKEYKESDFPPELVPQKVYTFNDNYWVTALESSNDDRFIRNNFLLDGSTSNIEHVKGRYIYDPRKVSPANATDDGDLALILPKGTRLRFVKDIVIGGSVYQFFTDGKVGILLTSSVNKYIS